MNGDEIELGNINMKHKKVKCVLLGGVAAALVGGAVSMGLLSGVKNAMPVTGTRSKSIYVIDDLRQQKRLLVYQHHVDVVICKEQVTEALQSIFSTTSTARVAYHNNKVQWYVDLSGVQEGDFVVDDEGKTVVVKIGRPVLDEEMVVVQTEGDQIQVESERGWASWPSTPTELVEDAKNAMKAEILEAARTRENIAIAENYASLTVKQLVRGLLGKERMGYEVKVEFRSE